MNIMSVSKVGRFDLRVRTSIPENLSHHAKTHGIHVIVAERKLSKGLF